MYKVKSDFLHIITERGLLHQASDLEGLDKELLKGQPLVAYLGSDPTADSLHIGNLCAYTLLKWWQKTGNKPIALAGGATGRIGDPSGRDSERPLVTEEIFQERLEGIRYSMKKFLKFGDGPLDAIMIDNYDWFKGMGYIEFITKYGRHFSVNEMIKRDSVKLRLEREQSLSFLEFNYSLFQGYDFYHIHKEYGATVQFGGADQWGNLVSGVDLGRKLGVKLFAVTNPLITDSKGKKLGKSEGNAMWVNEQKFPSYDYYQFFRNANDADVGKLLRIYTELPIDEIKRLEVLEGAEINEAKKILAFEATKMCRGEGDALSAEATAQETFERGGMGADLPTFNLDTDMNIVDALVMCNLAKSKSDARRAVEANSVALNNEKILDTTFTIVKASIDGKAMLSVGKKQKAVLEV